MLSLALAALAFVGIHVFISGTPLRDRLVARLGEKPYLGAFSLLSLATLVWMVWAYVDVHAPYPTAWLAWRWVAWVLVFVAFMFIHVGVTTRGPTGVGGEDALDRDDPARGIHRVTRHPFLVGMAIWSATHMAFNPQVDSWLFFGAFLALSLIGPRLIDAKRARRFGERWTRYAAVTSVVPFAAIAQGRNRLALDEIKLWQWASAVAIFAGFFLLHPWLFRMPIF